MSILSLRGSFRVAAEAGEGMSTSDEFHQVILALVSRRLATKSHVLDLGAGAGLFSKLLEKAGYSVTSADLIPERCSRPCVRVNANSSFSDQFTQRFDAICCFEVLEHLENPRATLRECRALLKPHGMLFISTPDVSGVYSRVRFLLTGEFAMFSDATYNDIGHITPISYWQIKKMFQETDLEVIEQLDYDGSALFPKTIGDAIKIVLRLLQPFLGGHVGRQVMVFVCRSHS